MDFQKVVINLARQRQSRGDGNGWYCACCKSWIKGTESYAVAITPVASGGHADIDNCVVACAICNEWIGHDRKNDPHKILKTSDIPYMSYKHHVKE